MSNPSPLVLRPEPCLIVIDVQQGFDDSAFWGERDNSGAERNIARLVEQWRQEGRPIVLVRHDSTSPSSPLHPSNPGNRFKSILDGVEPDLLISKNVNSAFYGTPDLHAWLSERGIRQLVLAGIQTNMCNETTARMAGNLGYDVLFVIDAMHTFGVAGPDGVVVSPAELSRATAASLHGGGFAQVVGTDAVLAAS